jgi:uncharacterized membrane protein SirB2
MANVALRFILELAGLVAVAWWGFHAADGATGWLLGVAGIVVFVVVWGLFVAPRARYPQPPRIRLVAGTVILLTTAALLATTGAVAVAVAFALLVVLNAVGIAVLGDGGLAA